MKLNTKARYALTAMATIARASDEHTPLSVRSLGRQTQISRYYLGQLLTQMVAAGLLSSQRGRGGGYLLAYPAAEISVGQIVKAVLGPINIIACIGRPEACILSKSCECRDLFRALNERIDEALDTFTLADLAVHQRISTAEISALIREHQRSGKLPPGRNPVPCRSFEIPS